MQSVDNCLLTHVHVKCYHWILTEYYSGSQAHCEHVLEDSIMHCIIPPFHFFGGILLDVKSERSPFKGVVSAL